MAAVIIRYELQALEEFVKLQCSPGAEQEPMAVGKLKRLEQFADAEVKKIRTNMTVQVLSIAKQRHIELYIQHHQAAIIHLSEIIVQAVRSLVSGNAKLWHSFYDRLQQQLQELLNFLKHYFEDYFDWFQLLPTYRRIGYTAQNFKRYIEELNIIKRERDISLLGILREHWVPIAEEIDNQLTFHREQYFDILFDHLATILKGEASEHEILVLLLQLNFNDGRFMDYCRMEMIAGLNGYEDASDKLNFLAERLKQLKQMPVQKTAPFNPSNPSIVAYCRNWMEEEYQFLQEQSKPKQALLNEDAQTDLEKLQTKFSVAQLGIMLQLIHKTGTVKLKNKTAFINFFARNLVTQNKEIISEKNLRNSFYNLDFKAKEGVKETLYEMLKILREFE